MATSTYFWHYIINFVAKIHKVYIMWYNYRCGVSLCMRVWKETIRKETMR